MGTEVRFPQEQASHVDLLETANGETLRLQFKTAQPVSSGFQVQLKTSAGTNAEGKRLYAPYPVDAFDALVVVAWIEGVPHFWKIPAATLATHGYFRGQAAKGKRSLVVHGPNGVGRAPKTARADTWTRKHYLE